jgi:hypothetical protein
MTRDAALKHIHEIDRSLGRELILRDVLDPNAEPSLSVVQLLPKQDIALALGPAVERIEQNSARDLDYELLDRYADGRALQAVQTVFAQQLGKFACAPQTAVLRYFLRVDPAYGAKQVTASLKRRLDTHCYSNLLQSLGNELPKVQQSAIERWMIRTLSWCKMQYSHWDGGARPMPKPYCGRGCGVSTPSGRAARTSCAQRRIIATPDRVRWRWNRR